MDVLLIDGECGFCARSADLVLRLHCAVVVEAWQRADLDALGVARSAAAHSVQLVTGHGVLAGHEAIGATLLTSPRWWARAVGRVVLWRPLRPVAARAYAYVSAHRRSLPGATPWCQR